MAFTSYYNMCQAMSWWKASCARRFPTVSGHKSLYKGRHYATPIPPPVFGGGTVPIWGQHEEQEDREEEQQQ